MGRRIARPAVDADSSPIHYGFGEENPRAMPRYFFREPIALEYESAMKADVAKQNFTVAPRQWYISATIRCPLCGDAFLFTAEEQKAWYEDYGFYVDSFPNRCKACRREIRDLKAVRQEYDRDIAAALASGDIELKSRVVSLIDRLCEAGEDLPAKVHENRGRLAAQIARRSKMAGPESRSM